MSRSELCSRLIALPRLAKQALVFSNDLVIVVLSLLTTTGLMRATVPDLDSPFSALVLIVAACAAALFVSAGFYRAIIRYFGSRFFLPALLRISLVAACVAVYCYQMAGWTAAASISNAVMFASLALLGLTAARLSMRQLLLVPETTRPKVVVYGAGDAGMRLIAAIASSGKYAVVAVVDDDPLHHGRQLNGVPILPPARLVDLARQKGVERVLLAIPSVSLGRRRQIIEQLIELPVRVQTVPDIADIIEGTARVEDLREVTALDLLGRDPVPPDRKLLAACIDGRSVLVTGAGGSIGSELCRQIANLSPRRLVLLETSEIALYRIEKELRKRLAASAQPIELVPLLGSVHHRDRVTELLRVFEVETVYHAAAYKHVPIVEENLIEGVQNNIIGTWYLAEACEAAGVDSFVLISTDKAVSPTSVMGATKRVAELTLQGMTERGSRTRFTMVRFGNVLESSGSVVPLFREQIVKGGPVTVTHPEVIRYFMTATEAAQLVLQAGSMGKGGDVFLLDMGDPVRIAALARNMIRLMGKTIRDDDNPDGEIAVEFTGLRPGEKLYEELLLSGTSRPTKHPMIRSAVEESLCWERIHACLVDFLSYAECFDCARASRLLEEIVHGYRPMTGRVEDLVWVAGREPGQQAVASRPRLKKELAQSSLPLDGSVAGG